jgi:two-component system, NtrC family, nitrogen regulation response regulator NtrX
MFPSILIVDDEPSILQSLSGILSDEGFEALTAANGYEALKVIEEESPDLVLLDIWMPGLDGIETLKEIKKYNPHIQVVIITGHGNVETAVKATKMGAFDLIEKPLSIDKIVVTINNALNFRRLEEENQYLRRKALEKHTLTGNSPIITELKKQIVAAAPTDKWIFIFGENGTGKELVAKTIHQLSPQADYPLIDVNCAAISEDLMDGELFGTEKGAFPKKTGKLELAGNGTLFLDEICNMGPKIQSKLLRVLQELKFERIGGSRPLDMKARIISSTNKDVGAEINKGNFREDLYYRLNVIPIHVPPLRERAEDIPLLVHTFLSESKTISRQKKKSITLEALELLCRYPWHGNVRELKNFVERLTIMVEKDVIDQKDVSSLYKPESKTEDKNKTFQFFAINELKKAREAFEKEFIQRKMPEFDNDIKKTARAIGVKADYLKKLISSGSMPD